MSDNIVKINLKTEKRDWNKFIIKLLEHCEELNSKEEIPTKLYVMNYMYDDIEMMLVDNINDVERRILRTISIDKYTYESGNLPDENIVNNLFRSLIPQE